MIFSTCSVSCSNNVINWSLVPTILHISTIAMYLLRLITSIKNINTVPDSVSSGDIYFHQLVKFNYLLTHIRCLK